MSKRQQLGAGDAEIHGAFGKRVRDARKQRGMTQEDLGDRMNVSRMVITTWESGRGAPDPDKAIQVAGVLGQDSTEFLLLAILQKAAPGNVLTKELTDVVDKLRLRHEQVPNLESTSPSCASHLSLMDFPHAFSPITVVVGDKREEDDPQNPGDLFVFSASTVDDRWLAALRLPPDTEKISDKVLMTAQNDPRWLKEKFGNRHILCIGSPASNLFAREHNRRFLFRFAISREATRKWSNKRDEMLHLHSLAELSKFYHDNKPDLKQIMRLFKPPGFVDFNYRHLKLGMDVGYNMDFAVISIGRNFYADENTKFFSILVAGIHHPGTATAVRFLADPKNFEKHPFGGVLEVEVPEKKYDPSSMPWHKKIEHCRIKWHTVGESTGNTSLEYSPQSLRKELSDKWLKKVKEGDVVTDVELDESEIDEHVALIDQLARE